MVKEDVFLEVKEYFGNVEDVVVSSGSGAQGLKYNKKMFAMFYKGGLIVKLSKDRVDQLIASGDGESHDPGTGKPMKDRVLIPFTTKDSWIAYCNESKLFVSKSMQSQTFDLLEN